MTNKAITVAFLDNDRLSEWLCARAPLPPPYEMESFGFSGEPLGKKPFTDEKGYFAYLSQYETYGQFFGRGFDVAYDRVTEIARLHFYETGDQTFVGNAANALLSWFAQWGAVHGHACLLEEWDYRNNHGVDIWNNGRQSSGLIGQDLRRYIPGLYWLNFFGQGFLEDRNLDVNSIVTSLGGHLTRLQHGVVLQLYERGEDWFENKERVGEFLAAHPAFFSMSHVKRPPRSRMTPAECVDYVLATAREWP